MAQPDRFDDTAPFNLFGTMSVKGVYDYGAGDGRRWSGRQLLPR
jgi:hypothetical protein